VHFARRALTMRARDPMKILRRLAGVILVVGAAWYLAGAFSRDFHAAAPLLGGGPLLWASMMATAAVYGASLFLLGWCWVLLLPDGVAARRALLHIDAATSIGRYFRGGIFHIGGRQAMGARAGLRHRDLLSASIQELIVSAGAALVIGAVLFLAPGAQSALAIIGLVGALLMAANLAAPAANRMIQVFLLSGAFMIVMAGIAMVCALIIGAHQTIALIGGAYLLAWCAGFVAPGVSAGIGVREAVLIFLLSGHVGVGEATALAIVMRLVTTLGDGLFFLAAFGLKREPGAQISKANN